MCNTVESKQEHNLKYGNTHDNYLFELNDLIFKKALDNLQNFYKSVDDMKLVIKEYLKNFVNLLLNKKFNIALIERLY